MPAPADGDGRNAADTRLERDGSPALWTSVNVSAHELAEPTFAKTVKATLLKYRIPPACLILELTQSSPLANTAMCAAAPAELHHHRVHIALDDFGMGFSSLLYLHELPIDMIKVDRAFVTNQDGGTHPMLEAIVTMGQSLGLTVIAEGIEERSELERLRGLGPVAGQGYLLARPMPAADAANYRGHAVRSSARIELIADVLVLEPT
jgi:diguanylate cyclase